MFLSDPGFICRCFCYLGLKELIHCTSLSMEYVLSFSCSGLRWRIFSSVDKFTRLFYNMHQHTNQMHIYCHCKYTASGKVQKIELSTEIHCQKFYPKDDFCFHIGSLLKTGLGQSYKLWLPVLASEHSKNFMNQHTIFLTVNQQIKQFCALQGDFSLTICLMIFQNNSVDFQVFPHNEDVHCSHFESLISKKERPLLFYFLLSFYNDKKNSRNKTISAM